MKKMVLKALITAVFLFATSLVAFADVVPVTSQESGFNLSGFTNPTNSKVEIEGTNMFALADDKGYFVITGVPQNAAGYKIKITKPGYLKRYIDITTFNDSLEICEKTSPIWMWAGDINQDGAINMRDVIDLGSRFCVVGNIGYVKDRDFNQDGAINMKDVVILAKNFNKTSDDYPKYIVLLPTPVPTPTPTPTITPTKVVVGNGRVEAESMKFYNYVEDSCEGIPCAKLTSGIGKVSYTFNGTYGYYDINIRYFDEAGGQSTMGLYRGNVRVGGSWILSEDDNQWKIKTIKGVLLNNGTEISLQGMKNGSESARVDYVETVFTYLPTPSPAPALITGRARVEWNDIEGGFYTVVLDGQLYDLGNAIPGIGTLAGATIEISGYVHPGWGSIHMCGVPFEVLSYKVLSTPVPTPTPMPG